MNATSWLLRATAAIAAAACLLLPAAVLAQETEEAAAEAAPAPTWTDQADLGFLLTNGNSENVSL